MAPPAVALAAASSRPASCRDPWDDPPRAHWQAFSLRTLKVIKQLRNAIKLNHTQQAASSAAPAASADNVQTENGGEDAEVKTTRPARCWRTAQWPCSSP